MNIRRRDILLSIERLQDKQHEYLQLQSKLIRERAGMVEEYHIARYNRELGAIDKALEDIQNEVEELKEMLK